MIFWTVRYTNTQIQIHKYTNTQIHIHITRQDHAVLPRHFLADCGGCGRRRELGTGRGAGELMGFPWAEREHQGLLMG